MCVSAADCICPPVADPARRAVCQHCGLPVPDALLQPEAPSFCCNGCRQVYQLIHGEGLDYFYSLSDGERTPPLVDPDREVAAAWDHPGFLALHCRREGALFATDLRVEGMYCSACIWLIEKGVGGLKGVWEARVDFGRGKVQIRFDPEQVALSRIVAAIGGFGYRVTPYRPEDDHDQQQKAERALLYKFGIAAAVAGNVTLLSVPGYVGGAHGLESRFADLFRWLAMVLTIPVVFYSALPFHRSAWHGLRLRTLSIDLPVSMGIFAAFFGSVQAIFWGGPVYFDSVNVLVMLLLASRVIVAGGTRKARAAAAALLSLDVRSVRVYRKGQWQDLPPEELVPGDRIELLPGETVPVDGEVINGISDLDTAVMTGESLPIQVQKGSRVLAGCRNGVGVLQIQAGAVGEATKMAEVRRLAEEAEARRSPLRRLTDRLAGTFTAGVFLTIAGASLYWWFRDPTQILPVAIAVAVVLCPCALALGTPLALAAAMGRAARRGVLIKGEDALERLASVVTVILDKTGTLTVGRPQIEDWQLLVEDEDLAYVQRQAAALESRSRHPIARAVCAAIPGPWPEATHVREEPGQGIRGMVAGRQVAIGRAADGGATVRLDGRAVARFAWRDPLRIETKKAVERLQPQVEHVMIASGDAPAAVERIATAIHVTRWRAALLPDQKATLVRQQAKHGPVLMVGDGLNDAAALAEADVGFAVTGGVQSALVNGDLFALKPGVEEVPWVLTEARRTMRIIHRNLAFSLLYNLVGGVLAVSGQITPLLAAILMPISSLTVLLSSYWVRPLPREHRRWR